MRRWVGLSMLLVALAASLATSPERGPGLYADVEGILRLPGGVDSVENTITVVYDAGATEQFGHVAFRRSFLQAAVSAPPEAGSEGPVVVDAALAPLPAARSSDAASADAFGQLTFPEHPDGCKLGKRCAQAYQLTVTRVDAPPADLDVFVQLSVRVEYDIGVELADDAAITATIEPELDPVSEDLEARLSLAPDYLERGVEELVSFEGVSLAPGRDGVTIQTFRPVGQKAERVRFALLSVRGGGPEYAVDAGRSLHFELMPSCVRSDCTVNYLLTAPPASFGGEPLDTWESGVEVVITPDDPDVGIYSDVVIGP